GRISTICTDNYPGVVHFHLVARQGKTDNVAVDVDIFTLVLKPEYRPRPFSLIHQQLIEFLSGNGINGLVVLAIGNQYGIAVFVMDSSSHHGNGQRLDFLPQSEFIDSFPTSIT